VSRGARLLPFQEIVTMLLRRSMLLSALALGLASAAGAQTTGKVYRFSPVNQWDIAKTAAYWNPIVRYVSDKSGVQLQLKIGRTSADTTSYVLAQEVEFIFSNHMFSPEREALGWRVFGRRNAPPIHGQIAVPDDSPIPKLSPYRSPEKEHQKSELDDHPMQFSTILLAQLLQLYQRVLRFLDVLYY